MTKPRGLDELSSYAGKPWLLKAMAAAANAGGAEASRAVHTPTLFARYRDDPVGFGVEVLGESFTPDIVRVMESVRDHQVTFARSGNGTGKTHAAARIAAWWYLCFPKSQVYTTAAPPEHNLRNLLWGEIGTLVAQHPDLFPPGTVKDMMIMRSKQEFITGVLVPSSGLPAERQARFSGKHAPFLLFIVDEGDAVPEPVYEGIEACMSGGHTRLLVTFNPRMRTSPIYRKERDGQAHVVELSALTHPNVVTGKNQIPGAVDRETTVRRINEWTRPLTDGEIPDGQSFELPDYLVGLVGKDRRGHEFQPLPAGWRRVTENQFSHMVLARYPAQSTQQLISEDWVDDAVTRWKAYVAQHGEVPAKDVRGVFGVDVGEYGPDPSVLCMRYGGWVARFQQWSHQDVLTTGDYVANAFVTFNGSRVCVDATGVGAGVGPQIGRCLQAQGVSYRRGDIAEVKVAEKARKKTEMGEFARLRDQLWWAVRDWLKDDPGAMLPPDEELRDELLAPEYEFDAGRRIKVTDKDKLRERLKRSPNKADALTLTFAPAGNRILVAFV